MAPDTIIKENNLLDVQDYLVDLDGGLTDENYALVRESNIGDFAEAARLYVSTYSGKVPFIIKLRRTIASKPLTLKQERAALNVMRDELRAGTLERAVTDGRRADHATASAEAAPLAEDEAAVVTSTRTTLDLSPLPDGRYAVYHPGKENGLLFLKSRRSSVRSAVIVVTVTESESPEVRLTRLERSKSVSGQAILSGSADSKSLVRVTKVSSLPSWSGSWMPQRFGHLCSLRWSVRVRSASQS